jgi:hypothetical protein
MILLLPPPPTLLQLVKGNSGERQLGRIGRWDLRLAPLKFKVRHVSGKTKVVADGLRRQYEDLPADVTFTGLVLQCLPEAFQSIREHQKKDPTCRDLYSKVVQGDAAGRHFKLLNGALVHHPSRTSAKRYVLPELLRPMILQYFHGSTLSAHLGANKTLGRIAKVFYWPRMRLDVSSYAGVMNARGRSPLETPGWACIAARWWQGP